MSALCIITTADEVIVATDGGSFRADGTLAQIGNKVLILAEASTVLTVRGSAYMSADLANAVRRSATRLDLDAILRALPDFARQSAPCHGEAASGRPVGLDDFEVCVAGWSEQRKAHEAWAVRSFTDDDGDAFAPVRLPECYLDEIPPKTAGAFGLRMPSSGEF